MEKIIEESKQGESLVLENKPENTKKLFIESYGCAMNFSDSEVVASILSINGYNTTQTLEDADLVLVNTCSIRDKILDFRIQILDFRLLEPIKGNLKSTI